MAYIAVNADVNAVWRKVQGELVDGINLKSEEFGTLKSDIPGLEIAPSLREMTFPVRLRLSRGVTSLTEGGREATPLTANAVDATVAFCHYNKRFSMSKLANWAQMDSEGRQASIKKQLVFEGMDAVDSMAAELAESFWGASTGVRCTTTTVATQSSGAYTVTNGHGVSSITDGTYITSMFGIGESVALVRSGALVTNAIGVVTAVNASTPSVSITWAGSVTSASGDQIVKANGYNATTLAHTSYNKNFYGMVDFLTATSLQGISSSTYSEWSVAHSDTTAGRFSGIKWRKGLDQIGNYGAGNKSVVTWMAQGVYRDVLSQMQAGLRFESPFALEIDGDVKGDGKNFQRTRRVPPGFVISHTQDAIKKRELLPVPDSAPGMGDAKEQLDDSGYTFALDYPALLATTGRKKFSYWSSQTEQ